MASNPQRHSTLSPLQSPTTTGGRDSSSTSLLTAEEFDAYSQFFKAANMSNTGIVSGKEAIDFFAKSNLSPNVLSEIWDIADEANTGSLNMQAFCVALKLIACQQHGKEPSKPLLSTAVPLPKFEGISITDFQDPGKPLLQPNEREKYIRIFHATRPENGTLTAEKAKNVFSRSKLPVDTLAQIWFLADTRKSGTLNQTEFIIAMYYVARCMAGNKDLPQALPPAIYAAAAGRSISAASSSPQVRQSVVQSPRQGSSPQPVAAAPLQPVSRQFTGASSAFSPAIQNTTLASPSLSANSSKWIISPEDKKKYDTFFDKIDVKKNGYIQGAEAVEFFQNSRLPDTDLAHIWDLADRHERGQLSRDEFAIAMYLIHKRLKGDILPTILPPSLLAQATISQYQTTSKDQGFSAGNSLVQSPTVLPAKSGSLLDDGAHVQQPSSQPAAPIASSGITVLPQADSHIQPDQTNYKKEQALLEDQLKAVRSEQKDLSSTMSQMQSSQSELIASVNKLKELIESEKRELEKTRDEAKKITEETDGLQAEKEALDTELENNRLESSRLKKDIFAKQEKSNQLRKQLQQLGYTIKKDRMMLDITRKQASAAESDVNTLSYAVEDAKHGSYGDGSLEALQTFPRSSQEITSPTADVSSSLNQRSGQRSKAAPPPPPPSSRHHQQAAEEKRNSSASTGKKPPAPPPASRSKGKLDSPSSAATTAAIGGAAVTTGAAAAAGVAVASAKNDDFDDNDPFDEFSRTFEAAKESTQPSDFDEVFGNQQQPSSDFSSFPEQQSFSGGFEDDFSAPLRNPPSTQPIHPENAPAQAPAPEKEPESEASDATESDSESESESGTESDTESNGEGNRENEVESAPTQALHDEDDTVMTVGPAQVSHEPAAKETEIETSAKPAEHIVDEQTVKSESVVQPEVLPAAESVGEEEEGYKADMSSADNTVDNDSAEVVDEPAAGQEEEQKIASTPADTDTAVATEEPSEEPTILQPVDQEDSGVQKSTEEPAVAEPAIQQEAEVQQSSEEIKKPVEIESFVAPATSETLDIPKGNDQESTDVLQGSASIEPPAPQSKIEIHGVEEQEPAQAPEADETPAVEVAEEAPEIEPTISQQVPDQATEQLTSSNREEKADHDFEVIDPVSSTSSFVSDGMNASIEQSPFDDFDSAFSGSMSEAKVMPTSSNPEFEAPFDTSFEDEFNPTFDQPDPVSSADRPQEASEAASFANSFNFDNSAFDNAFGTSTPSPTSQAQPDNDTTPKLEVNNDQPYLHSGFSSFAPALEGSSTPTTSDKHVASFSPQPPSDSTTNTPTQSRQTQNSATASPPIDSSTNRSAVSPAVASGPPGLEELLNMGFSREQGIDALRRYDNDLEKATNFLLDN